MIIIADPINSQNWVYPISSVYTKLFNMYVRFASMRGVHCNFGMNLYSFVKSNRGISLINIDSIQPVTSEPNLKNMLALAYDFLQPQLVDLKFIGQNESEIYRDDLNKLIADPNITFGLPPQVVATCVKH